MKQAIIKFINNRSGASMLLVLSVMLMLMAIGVSALTAAGLNHGASIAQRSRAQNELLVSSMERTVKAALDAVPASVESLVNPSTLTGRILSEIDWSVPDFGPGGSFVTYPYDHGFGFTMTADAPGDNITYDFEVSIRLTVQAFPYVRYESGTYDEFVTLPDGTVDVIEVNWEIDAEPLQAMINGEIRVVQEMRNAGQLIMITRTDYQYSGGMVEERALTGGTAISPGKTTDPDNADMFITEHGTWKVVRHETIYAEP